MQKPEALSEAKVLDTRNNLPEVSNTFKFLHGAFQVILLNATELMKSEEDGQGNNLTKKK